MQKPPDDRVTARIGIAARTGIVLLRRVEELTGEFDKVAVRWRTEVHYEVPELLACRAVRAKPRSPIPSPRWLMVDISAYGLPFMRQLIAKLLHFGLRIGGTTH
jgi:hypothetical protein